MNASEILEILSDWNYWGNYRIRLKKRVDYLNRVRELISPGTALVVQGIRRAGKSSLIHLYCQELFEKGEISVSDCLIINLEDPRFSQRLTSGDLHRIFEVYLENVISSKPVIVLDEVQNVEGWQRFVRFLLESKNLNVIVTGSSAKLLSQEISTTLTGRHTDIELLPLSFREILEFKERTTDNLLEIVRDRIDIKRWLNDYTRWGGFPEVVLSDSESRKRELLVHYFDDILFKDLVKRYMIKEVYKLEQMVNILTANISTLQSFNRLKNQVNLSLDTVERFSRYLENVGLFVFLKKFDYSTSKQLRSIRKVYLIDTGFYFARGFRFSKNAGKLMENLVGVELLKKRVTMPELELYYWRDYQQHEVDFVVKSGSEISQLIQVCRYVSDPMVLKREIRNLLRAGAELNCTQLLIITEDYEEEAEHTIGGISGKIRFIPLWKWLLLSR